MLKDMDLSVFFGLQDEGEPRPPTPTEEQGDRGQLYACTLSLSKRTETIFTDLVNSAKEDIQHKLQEIADNTRKRVSRKIEV